MKKTTTILIIDDDTDDVLLFCDAASELDPNIQCISAVNVQDALQVLYANKNALPDFIFLDLNMPRLNGKECLVQLKNNVSLSGIPVVIYTTSKLEQDIEETKRLGAAFFLTKPTRLNDLKQAISTVVQKKRKSGNATYLLTHH